MKIKFKRIISVILVEIMLLSNLGSVSVSATDTNESKSLDILDTIIAAHIFMFSDEAEENCWPSEIVVKSYIPLYNPTDKIVAWYLEFGSGEYAVINNNTNNPVAIEFGFDGNRFIKDILSTTTDPHIVYNNPEDVYNSSDVMTDTLNLSIENNLYTNYPQLLESNTILSELLKTNKNLIAQKYPNISARGDQYGVINPDELPSGDYSAYSLTTTDVPWIIMDTYESSTIWNHCAATAATNYALYFSRNGYSDMAVNGNVDDTFYGMHAYVLNGPRTSATGVAADIAKFVYKYTDYVPCSSVLSSYSAFKNAILYGRPCMLYLENTLLEAHWVLGVGYRTYSNGNNYMRVVNGWYNHANKYYLYGSTDADLVHILSLWVE